MLPLALGPAAAPELHPQDPSPPCGKTSVWEPRFVGTAIVNVSLTSSHGSPARSNSRIWCMESPFRRGAEPRSDEMPQLFLARGLAMT